jgi:hypothetical protein
MIIMCCGLTGRGLGGSRSSARCQPNGEPPMTAQNKVSLVLTVSLIGSPATNPPLLFCGLLIECAIG